jgi:ketose-bisphosphate aldolase
MNRMLAAARRGGWAVAAFNPVDYASLKAIVSAATRLDAPIIAQTSAKTVRYYGHQTIVNWARELAADSPVPVSLHLDHGKELDMIEGCIETGWTDVMIDASDKPYDENVELTGRVCAWAREKGVGVEAEIGQIGGVEEDIAVLEDEAHNADAEQALAFCNQFDLAVFAPAIGTAHGVYKHKPSIQWDTLKVIYEGTEAPFALHGGTGLSDEVFERCIKLGCAKVNISTNLKHVFIDGFADYHTANPDDYEPLRVLGAQFEAMEALVMEMIRKFGGEGRAAELR